MADKHEITSLRDELKQTRVSLTSWQESWKQAKAACDAWKIEAEQAIKRAESIEKEREKLSKERDKVCFILYLSLCHLIVVRGTSQRSRSKDKNISVITSVNRRG